MTCSKCGVTGRHIPVFHGSFGACESCLSRWLSEQRRAWVKRLGYGG